MRINVEINETTLTNDDDRDVDGVIAYCSKCGHETESYGTGDNSRLRCLALMREECPNGERNFYVEG